MAGCEGWKVSRFFVRLSRFAKELIVTQQRLAFGCLLSAWLGHLLAGTVQAQGSPAPSNVQPVLRSLWPEIAITVALVLLVLYVVCRNSKRQ